MECAKSLELLSDYLAGSLDDGDRDGVSDHLIKCPPCADVHKDLKTIITISIELREEAPATISYPDENTIWQRVRMAKGAGS